MKKIIAILLLPIFLSGCITSIDQIVENKPSELDKLIYIGQQKKDFCWARTNIWYAVICYKYDLVGFPADKYYQTQDFEVLASKYNRYYVFKNVTNTYANLNKVGNGTLDKTFTSMYAAKDYVNKKVSMYAAKDYANKKVGKRNKLKSIQVAKKSNKIKIKTSDYILIPFSQLNNRIQLAVDHCNSFSKAAYSAKYKNGYYGPLIDDVLKVNAFTLDLASAAVLQPSTDEYFFAVLTAKIAPLIAVPSVISIAAKV